MTLFNFQVFGFLFLYSLLLVVTIVFILRASFFYKVEKKDPLNTFTSKVDRESLIEKQKKFYDSRG